MNQGELRDRLSNVHELLIKAREELAVSEEQLVALDEDADDAKTRSLVAESRLADHEWREAQRAADAMRRGRDLARARVTELEKEQDDLLEKLVI